MQTAEIEQTKIEQKAGSALLSSMGLAVPFGLAAYMILRSPGGMSEAPGPKVVAGIAAIASFGWVVLGFLFSKYPAYIIIRKNSFSLKSAIGKNEETFNYEDVLYFESEAVKLRGTVIIKNYAVIRPGVSPRRVKLPSFEALALGLLFRSAPNRKGEDFRVFKLLKAALESWQADHGIVVQPRLADSGSDIFS